MKRTGLAYSAECLKHIPYRGIPEVPERVSGTIELFKNVGLLDKLNLLSTKPASQSDLGRIHSQEHIDYVRKLSEGGYADFDMTNPDIYVGPGTYSAALSAAGCVMSAVDSVLDADVDNCFCLVRPPGHHAATYPSGFCYFNNTAVAIKYAMERQRIDRAAIFDWDAHAGNGTMKLFYEDPSVLTISVHRDPHEFFPGDGFTEQIGDGAGRGFCINAPVPAGTGDADYTHILDELVLDALRRYKPQMIFVAAGQDSHETDPMGGLNLTDHGYASITRRLMDLAEEVCGGRLILTLEGGYNLKTLPTTHQEIVETLMGERDAPKGDGKVLDSTRNVIQDLRDRLKGTPLYLE
jgi:acetoin utilization deacetylase AcuC-like enzyme